MSIAFIINIAIALIVVGFLYWAVTQLVRIIPLPPMISQMINVLLVILLVAVVIFYVIIPVLELLGGIHIGLPAVR